jgi:hypothetical protein
MTPLEAFQIISLYSYKSTLALSDNERLESTQQLDILKEIESSRFLRDHEGHIWSKNAVCLKS